MDEHERWIPREAVEVMTGLSKSVITKYHRQHNLGEISYSKEKMIVCLLFSIYDVQTMLQLYKLNTSTPGKRQAQLNRSKMLWYEFLQRVIGRLDKGEEDRTEMKKQIWALRVLVKELEEKIKALKGA